MGGFATFCVINSNNRAGKRADTELSAKAAEFGKIRFIMSVIHICLLDGRRFFQLNA